MRLRALISIIQNTAKLSNNLKDSWPSLEIIPCVKQLQEEFKNPPSKKEELMSIHGSGIPTKDDLKKVIPPSKVLAQGPVVIVECFQNIPCDPCAASCPSGAIQPFEDINDLPLVDYD